METAAGWDGITTLLKDIRLVLNKQMKKWLQ